MNIYQQTNIFLEHCFKTIELDAPKPQTIDLGSKKALRYPEKTFEIAVLQKLARYISGLNASFQLLTFGYTQEVGVIFRTLDEFQEDIFFLCIPISGGENSQHHKEYLENFYQEEFDNPNSALLSTQNRKTISRKNIHAAISKLLKNALNPSDAQRAFRSNSQTYSGYVHGTSVHIIEMIDSNKLTYYLSGMPKTFRQKEFTDNYWNYAYRGIVTMIYVSSIFGYPEICKECLHFRDYFESSTGETGQGDAEKLVQKIKSKNKKHRI